MTAFGYELALYCSPMQRDTVRVSWQYVNPRTYAMETLGTLHLSERRFKALVRMLRKGGGLVKLAGPYLAQHPDFHRLGTSHDTSE